jgi:hypothetical protein
LAIASFVPVKIIPNKGSNVTPQNLCLMSLRTFQDWQCNIWLYEKASPELHEPIGASVDRRLAWGFNWDYESRGWDHQICHYKAVCFEGFTGVRVFVLLCWKVITLSCHVSQSMRLKLQWKWILWPHLPHQCHKRQHWTATRGLTVIQDQNGTCSYSMATQWNQLPFNLHRLILSSLLDLFLCIDGPLHHCCHSSGTPGLCGEKYYVSASCVSYIVPYMPAIPLLTPHTICAPHLIISLLLVGQFIPQGKMYGQLVVDQTRVQ